MLGWACFGILICVALFGYSSWASNETDRYVEKIRKEKNHG